MKYLKILVLTLSAALLFSCGKKNPDAPSHEEEIVVEIKTIELRKSSLEIDIKMEEGKVIEVVTPSYMEVPLKRLGARIEDESIVSVSFEESAHGFRVLPKAVGKTEVVIYADEGPAYAIVRSRSRRADWLTTWRLRRLLRKRRKSFFPTL